MAFYGKIEILPDGGQQITWWEVDTLKETFIDEFLGVPHSVNLLTQEQVVNSRDAVGTFASVPGGLDVAKD